MNEEMEMRLAKWFDGEADPVEAREVEKLLESNAEARAALSELRRMRDAMAYSHTDPSRVPQWSQLDRQLEKETERKASAVLGFPRMAGLTAIIVLSGMAVWLPFRNAGEAGLDQDNPLVDRVESVETDLEGATPVVYLDQPSGWTVVWILESEETGDI